MLQEPSRARYLRRLTALQNERNSWVPHWVDLADNLLPRRVRFYGKQSNIGSKVNQNIFSSSPVRALRIMASGMMASLTSPSRPWFRLSTPDPTLSEVGNVRSWLHVVEERIREILAKSNIYNALASVFQDLGCFGTAVMFIDEDPQDMLRAYVLPLGTYALANSARLQVDTLYRETRMTVAQLVDRFGMEACSASVQNRYTISKDLDSWIDVIHVIEPNVSQTAGRLDAKSRPWRSCWFEKTHEKQDAVLLESGYHEFPALAVRWDVTGEDVYGRSPGMDALGDIKGLHLLTKRMLQFVDKTSEPPTVGPSSLRDRFSLRPGAYNVNDALTPNQKVEPLFVIDPRSIQETATAIAALKQSVDEMFYADLWLMMADTDRRQITATEVDERRTEKMLQLGPVFERVMDELLDPLMDRAFGIAFRNGSLPEPPPELHGVELRVEYMSTAAQAMKAQGSTSVERFVSFAGNMAGSFPGVLDKINADEVVDEYANMLAIKPDLVRPDDQVKVIRDQKAQQAQAAQQAQMAMQGIQGAKLLSETDTGGSNALAQLMGGQQGGVP